ncbi:hypothetical protein [Deinococcus yunweiensis]|uniref:hypothetical protein n=1 Tax=Deinococcus yunweiensis TaxID=367282 RepID=UPI00398EFF56
MATGRIACAVRDPAVRGLDPQAYALLAAFHQHAHPGRLTAGDLHRLHAFIHHVAAQPVGVGRIVNETVTYLVTHPHRPWRVVVAQDLSTRIRHGVELLRFEPAPP